MVQCQAMAGNASGSEGISTNYPTGFQPHVPGMQGNIYGSMLPGMQHTMYGNIGMQQGMQGMMQPGMLSNMYGNLGGPAGMMGMHGYGAPYLQPTMYDNLTSRGKSKDYKDGEATVKFESFNGTQDKLKAFTFIQQFDAAYSGGNFTEASKVRKAATFLKGNALQWWTTLLLQGRAPLSWVQFK